MIGFCFSCWRLCYKIAVCYNAVQYLLNEVHSFLNELYASMNKAVITLSLRYSIPAIIYYS